MNPVWILVLGALAIMGALVWVTLFGDSVDNEECECDCESGNECYFPDDPCCYQHYQGGKKEKAHDKQV